MVTDRQVAISWWVGLPENERERLAAQFCPEWPLIAVDKSTSTITRIFLKWQETERKKWAERIISSVTDDYGIVDCADCEGLKQSWASVKCEVGDMRMELDGPTIMVARIIEIVLEG